MHAQTQAYTHTHTLDSEHENKSQQGAVNFQITLNPAGVQAQVQTVNFHDRDNDHADLCILHGTVGEDTASEQCD